MEDTCHQFPNLQIIYIAEYVEVIRCMFPFIVKPKSLSFTCSHIRIYSFSFAAPLIVIRCHSLSLVVSLFVNRCLSLPLVVTCCHLLYHSMSFVVIRCQSLYHSLTSLSLDVPFFCLNINDRKTSTVKPLNSGHLPVSKNLSVIERCPLVEGNLKKIITLGTKCFDRYSWHVHYLGCSLLGGFTV